MIGDRDRQDGKKEEEEEEEEGIRIEINYLYGMHNRDAFDIRRL